MRIIDIYFLVSKNQLDFDRSGVAIELFYGIVEVTPLYYLKDKFSLQTNLKKNPSNYF